jgi:3'-5' exoribonuclease 1
MEKQPFDYYLVIDFEANCLKDDDERFTEIIEFPIVCVNAKSLEIEKSFHTFVKPTIFPEITPFCSLLTGIVQDDVENAPYLWEALELVHKFLQDNEFLSKYTFAIACDGPWDMQNFLHNECMSKKLSKPDYFNEWVSIRSMHNKYYKTKQRMGVERMLAYSNMSFIGNPHSGLDDSKNIARILMMIQDGCVVNINESIIEK